jgi:hypothetical protein
MTDVKIICKTWHCRRRSCPYHAGANIDKHKPGEVLLPVNLENKEECAKTQNKPDVAGKSSSV